MREHRSAKVPKYAIEQILDSRTTEYDENGNIDDINSGDCQFVDGNRYWFKLDPSFAFAEGVRKSIAIRDIRVHDRFYYTQKAEMRFVWRYTKPETYGEPNPEFEEGAFTVEITCNRDTDIDDFVSSLVANIKKMLQMITGETDETPEADRCNVEFSYDVNTQNLTFMYVLDGTKFPDFTCYISDKALTANVKNARDFFSLSHELTPTYKREQEGPDASDSACVVQITYPYVKHKTYQEYIFAGSFVNHTHRQIIGSNHQDYSFLNQIYPYDEKTDDFYIAVYDHYKNPVTNMCQFYFTLKLSLVCDSDYSYVMDD